MDKTEYIKKKGGIEILCELSEGEKGFNELKRLDISPSTLSTRLREALDLNFVEQVIHREESLKPKISYRLTEKGKEVVRMIESIRKDYFRLKEEVKKLEEEVKKKKKEMEELLSFLNKGRSG